MGAALITALVAAFLLSEHRSRADGAHQPATRLLDFRSCSHAAGRDLSRPIPKPPPNLDTAAQVSKAKIERIGQRMRNVEEVFSALKENLDQILGNLQDGILLFTADGRAVLVSEAARRFLIRFAVEIRPRSSGA